MNRTELIESIARWLNRSDLYDEIPTFIANAEARFKREHRVRKLQDYGSFTISQDNEDLPSDLQSVDSWYHDGPDYFHRIEVLSADVLGNLKEIYGVAGAPRYAAIVDGKARFAPVPDESFQTKLTYFRTIEPLTDATPSNWLLEEHPDVYLYASLLESAPFLKNDERIEMWNAILEQRLTELDAATRRMQHPERIADVDPRITRSRP